MTIQNPLTLLGDRLRALETTGVPSADIEAIIAEVAAGVDKTSIGLGDVDNTSDAQKVAEGPIADFLAAKLSKADPIVGGPVRAPGATDRVIISGGETGISAGVGTSDGGFVGRGKSNGSNPGGVEAWAGGVIRFAIDLLGRATAMPLVQKALGTVYRDLAEILGKEVSPRDYGAKGDGVTDDSAAIDLWFAALKTSLSSNTKRHLIGIVDGWFRYGGGNKVWNFEGRAVKIIGSTKQRSGFYLDAGYTWLWTGNADDSTSVGSFYQGFHDFLVSGNVDDVVLRVGRDSNVDAFNSCAFFFNVTNASQTDNAVCVRFNRTFESDFHMVINANASGRPDASTYPGKGTALQIRTLQFCKGKLAVGNANVGIEVLVKNGTETGGNTHSNTFNVDIEEVYTGLKNRDTAFHGNRFAGQHLAMNIFDSTAGYDNVFEGNFPLYSGGALFAGTNFKGIIVKQIGGPGVVTPTIPASGTILYNTTGRKVRFWTAGGTVSTTLVSKYEAGNYNGYTPPTVSGTAINVELNPGDGITLTYTGTPAWKWMAAD